ncbi:MAG: hypothetical protein R3Y36_05265 [Spirochaetales bacterium]
MEKDVNEIYRHITEKTVSLEDGIKHIAECIFLAPQKFGFYYIDRDLRSEFMLYLLENLPNYIKNYCEGRAKFSTYMSAIINNVKKSWYRQYCRHFAYEASIQAHYINEELILQDTEPCAYYLNQHDFKTEGRKPLKCSRTESLRLLILGLKSCYYLTPEHIAVLSEKTGYSQEQIYRYKFNLETLMQQRIDKNKCAEEKINTAYMKKNRCFIELARVQAGSPLAVRIQKSHAYYTDKWKQKRKNLSSGRPLRPTNDEISRVLDMQQHQIYQALLQIKKQYAFFHKN